MVSLSLAFVLLSALAIACGEAQLDTTTTGGATTVKGQKGLNKFSSFSFNRCFIFFHIIDEMAQLKVQVHQQIEALLFQQAMVWQEEFVPLRRELRRFAATGAINGVIVIMHGIQV